jgi:hypothetical protein
MDFPAADQDFKIHHDSDEAVETPDPVQLHRLCIMNPPLL